MLGCVSNICCFSALRSLVNASSYEATSWGYQSQVRERRAANDTWHSNFSAGAIENDTQSGEFPVYVTACLQASVCHYSRVYVVSYVAMKFIELQLTHGRTDAQTENISLSLSIVSVGG